ncbi:MAG TPA: CocE/NonD family hydrolase [Thermoleophilia bacterium]|nr:CocE/NonD family hydrolase [Thermoleophilia bacterium]
MNVRDQFPRRLRVLDHQWITLSDGTRLHCRIWLPDDAPSDPVPAILEASPYRLTDGGQRDWDIYPYWAGCGYACARVDLRGTGDSEGLIADEYTAQEQRDVCEVIAWLAAQPWCSGNVGMTGISWTGFNSLQVAALRPPALKAVITLMSTDDRYADDVHYKGGCVSGLDMLAWGGTMLHFNALPAHPQVVGTAGWRERWLERLGANFDWTETWLAHQRRDDYWKHGSVCEDFGAIEAAVYAIGGWTDGYHNAVMRLLAGLPGPRKGLIGPWSHCFPNQVVPGPAIGYLQEALRFWDHWLKGIDTGVMDEPMLRVWMEDYVAPAPLIAEHPGRWVAEESWPSPRLERRVWTLGDGTLGEAGEDAGDATGPAGEGRGNAAGPAPVEVRLVHRGLQLTGMDAGAWCAEGTPGDWPLDQRAEDGRSLCFTSAPLAAPLEILGTPEVALQLAVDKPRALICVRLCDVAPDGCSKLVTRQVLNLTHRDSHETPAALVPGERFEATVTLDSIAHAFAAGHRLRVAVSSQYWPWVWPSPEPVELHLFAGAASRLALPVRPARADDEQLTPFDEAEVSAALPSETLVEPGSRGRRVDWDIDSDTMRYEYRWLDGGRYRDTTTGIVTEDHCVCSYELTEGDPLSAVARLEGHSDLVRGAELEVRIDTLSELRSSADEFVLTDEQRAYDHGELVFEAQRRRRIPRDLV